MPSASELSAEQMARRAQVLDVLTTAGWTPDTALWDAGIATDFVASAQLRRFGSAARCDYVVGVGGGMPECLIVRWNLPDGEVPVVVDFLGSTSGGADALTEALHALTWGQQHEGDDWVPATIAALSRACPLFAQREDGLVPITPGQDQGRAEQESAAATPPVPSLTVDDESDDDDVEWLFGDAVEERLHHELRRAGWRRSSGGAVLLGKLETFFVRNGPVALSVGRVNAGETRVLVTHDEGGTIRLRVDDLARPEDADRLITLLREWQDQITEDNAPDFADAVACAYATVYVEDDEGDWRRFVPAQYTREPASPPPGAADRVQLTGAVLAGAGWTAVPAADGASARWQAQSRSGTVLRCEHVTGAFPTVGEALVLAVELPTAAPPFGDRPVFVLDVLDLASGRGGRDQLAAALEVITSHRQTADATTLPILCAALQLRCPLFYLYDGRLVSISRAVTEYDDEPRASQPRALAELDRLVAAPGGDTAALWLERGLAALIEDRPDLALESFDAAIDREPGNGAAHYQRGLVIHIGDVAEAGRSFLRCAELGYAVGPALVHHAGLLGRCGHREQEAEAWRHLSDRLPEYGPGWYHRALAAVQDGRYDESIEAASRAVALMPEHGNAFYTRACAYALSGRPEPAFADIQVALEVDPSLRSDIRDDEDFAALRSDPRFTELVDPWPDGDTSGRILARTLVDVLRPAGWRRDDLAVSLGSLHSLDYPCPAGRLIVGLRSGSEYYVNLRPTGRGEAGEAWLYTDVADDPAGFGKLLVTWQEQLTAENFPHFADEVQRQFPETSWHRGHP